MSDRKPQPFLSIVIPTFDRVAMLSCTLRLVCEQAQALVKSVTADVEVIVGDDAGPVPDQIRAVTDRWATAHPIRYLRNRRNLTMVRNIARLVRRCAGRYVWVLGDDDLLYGGALRRVVDVLHRHPEIAFLTMNCSAWHPSGPPPEDLRAEDVKDAWPRYDRTTDAYLVRSRQLIWDCEMWYSGIYNVVLSREHWRRAAALARGPERCFDTPGTTCPQALYILTQLLDAPSFYIGASGVLCSLNVHWLDRAQDFHQRTLTPLERMFWATREFPPRADASIESCEVSRDAAVDHPV